MLRELGHRSQVATQAALAATREQLEGNTVFSKERIAKATSQIKILEDAARDAQKLYIDRLHHVDWTVLMQRLENIRQNEAARLKAESNEDHLEEAQRIEFLYSKTMLVTTLRFTIRSLVAPLADALPNPVHGGTYVKFNRGPQGNVGIKCEKFGSGAKITDLSPDGPAFFCGKLAVGDVIESVDDKALRSLSLVEIVESLKGEAGSEITLYILNRGAAVEREGGRERERERERVREGDLTNPNPLDSGTVLAHARARAHTTTSARDNRTCIHIYIHECMRIQLHTHTHTSMHI
jgi:hypothetical protein